MDKDADARYQIFVCCAVRLSVNMRVGQKERSLEREGESGPEQIIGCFFHSYVLGLVWPSSNVITFLACFLSRELSCRESSYVRVQRGKKGKTMARNICIFSRRLGIPTGFLQLFCGMCNKCRVSMSPKVKRALTFLLGICIIFHAMFPLCTDKLILRTYLMKIDLYSFMYTLAPELAQFPLLPSCIIR